MQKGCSKVGVIRQAWIQSMGVRLELLKNTVFCFYWVLGHETTISANRNLCVLIFINSINMHPAILNVYENWLSASIFE